MKISESQCQEYLSHALELRPQEVEKIEEYAEWLPPAIIDAHAHSNLPEHAIDVPCKAYNHMLSTFPGYTIEESQEVHRLLHPETQIRSIRFAKTFKGIVRMSLRTPIYLRIAQIKTWSHCMDCPKIFHIQQIC